MSKHQRRGRSLPGQTVRAGVALLGLGVSGYWGGRRRSKTALIPALFGGALVAAGGLASISPAAKPKALRVAALVATVGLIGAARGPIQIIKGLKRGELPKNPIAASAQTSMAMICGKLCVRFAAAALRGELSSKG
jgi:hypothetical protein